MKRRIKKEKKSNLVGSNTTVRKANNTFDVYKKGAFIGGVVGGISGLMLGRKILLGIFIGSLLGGYINYEINK